MNFERNVKSHYLEDRGEDYHLKKRKLDPALVPWVARLRAEKFQSRVQPSDAVFEYGAGSGWNLISLKCASRHAYDVSDVARRHLEQRGIICYESEEKIPRDAFDVVICHHVLEHVPHPGSTLVLLRDFLKSDGSLILVVPQEFQRLGEVQSTRPGGASVQLDAANIG